MKKVFAIALVFLMLQLVFVVGVQFMVQHWENVASVESDTAATLREELKRRKEIQKIRAMRKRQSFDVGEFKTLAKTIYFESAGEKMAGMVSVAQVVMERVNDCTFPTTIKKVVYQPNQFEWTFDKIPNTLVIGNKIDAKAWDKAQMVALAFLTSEEPIQNMEIAGANLYHSIKVMPYWANHPKVTFVKQVGNHLYYTEQRRKCKPQPYIF